MKTGDDLNIDPAEREPNETSDSSVSWLSARLLAPSGDRAVQPHMNTGSVARLLNVSPHTIYRWARTYRDFLHGDATPPDGLARLFCERDVQVLLFVAQLRREGMAHESIEKRLEAVVENGWKGLPKVPDDWQDTARNVIVPTSFVKRRGQEGVQLAHISKELGESTQALRRDKMRIQELSARVADYRQILEAKEKDLSAKDELIAEQRRMLQMVHVALKLDAEQRAARKANVRHRRRIACLILLVLFVLAIAGVALFLY